jgi:hypothetical protein
MSNLYRRVITGYSILKGEMARGASILHGVQRRNFGAPEFAKPRLGAPPEWVRPSALHALNIGLKCPWI